MEESTAVKMIGWAVTNAHVAGTYYGVPFSGRVTAIRRVTVMPPHSEELSIELDCPIEQPGGGEEGGVILLRSDDVDSGKHSVDRTMGLVQAAGILSIIGKTERPPHIVTLQRWCRRGLIKAYKSADPGSPWRVTRQALEEFEPPTPGGRRGAWTRWESTTPGDQPGAAPRKEGLEE